MTLTFDEALDETVMPSETGLQRTLDGGGGMASTAVSISGRTVTGTFATLRPGTARW